MKRKGEELKRESRRRLSLKFGLCVVPVLSAPSASSAVKPFGCGGAALGNPRLTPLSFRAKVLAWAKSNGSSNLSLFNTTADGADLLWGSQSGRRFCLLN